MIQNVVFVKVKANSSNCNDTSWEVIIIVTMATTAVMCLFFVYMLLVDSILCTFYL